MSTEKYPADLIVTLEDFNNSGWQEAISGQEREGYTGMWSALSDAALKVIAGGKTAEGKVLWLLADVCSMMLKSESLNNPYAPYMVITTGRSAIPEDFTENDINFFSEIVEQVGDPWLQGRLSDLVWLCSKPRDVKYALLAIDSFRQLPFEPIIWVSGSRDSWDRAFRLALMLSGGADDRVVEMRKAVLDAFHKTTGEDGYLGIWLCELLEEHRLGGDDSQTIAEHLEVLANQFAANDDFHRYRDYYYCAAKWYKKAGNEAKSAEMLAACAEGWVSEAEVRITSEQPSHMVATSFYDNAIQVYRSIPRAERGPYKVDERIKELRGFLNDSGEMTLGEMGKIASHTVNITDMVEHAREAMRGKELSDAFMEFSILGRIDAESIRESAEKLIQHNPLTGLLPATVFKEDGRVIAKHPGMNLGDSEQGKDESGIWPHMIRHYSIQMGLIVQGAVLPALQVLQQEHRLQEQDFVGLCQKSPIVPVGRERLWGKALYAGYDGDFVAALHLLCPQIENMVRVRLKAAGEKTTTLNRDGIETENGLSTLLDLPEIKKAFDPNICFEFRAIFCDAFGPNLRNEVAHGLLPYETCHHSIQTIYAWWFGFRLIFLTFWKSTIPNDEDGPQSDIEK